jgi:hypothetical protein
MEETNIRDKSEELNDVAERFWRFNLFIVKECMARVLELIRAADKI